MMKAIHSSETSVRTRATWHNFPENGPLHVTAVRTSILIYFENYLYFAYLSEPTQIELNVNNGIFWDVKPCGSCKTHVSEELSSSIIRVTRIGELGTLAVSSNQRTLRQVPPKRRFLLEPHSVTSQKTPPRRPQILQSLMWFTSVSLKPK
jgi:hypothetical protein